MDRGAGDRQVGHSGAGAAAGEERILHSEWARLRAAGRSDLASKVRWVAQEDGDGAGFDILSFASRGEERCWKSRRRPATRRRHSTFRRTNARCRPSAPRRFVLVRVYNFLRGPRAFELVPPLELSVMLQPINYRASFGN